MPSKHQRAIELERKATLSRATVVLDEMVKLHAAVRRCVDGGGFPIYLDDLVEYTSSLTALAASFHALGNVQYTATRMKRRKK